ncbi:LOW QUALITY PROTEIN: hypothetical protein Cgig2_015137 [Carnegiea gigantea]|uniref:Uncharacterized protein n=1 Tax=Carnegiea gigantea TaxID=171969 RepID=A0A9Q1KRV4_9CARY|nr:LOW QUALITY PROTEIN: hypothetical protein Cgig2_015137 [Carnegiea gigantea]
MFECDCFYWSRRSEYYEADLLPEPIHFLCLLLFLSGLKYDVFAILFHELKCQFYSLFVNNPWIQFRIYNALLFCCLGEGFGSGRIWLGQLEVAKITTFESIWSCSPSRGKAKRIPDGFFCLGYYCQSNDRPLRGYVLVVREMDKPKVEFLHSGNSSPQNSTAGFIWLPNPPIGYRAMGFIVSDTPVEPSVDDIRCVRVDLTEDIESCNLLISTNSISVWDTRPCRRGIFGRGVSVGTFFCSTDKISEDDVLTTACLKNPDPTLHAMPNLNQIHALVNHYGPTVYFHPDETFLPSSVEWFFDNGALLYESGKPNGEHIDSKGSILHKGRINDGDFWIDFPKDDDKRNCFQCGNLESAELYVHVKPALGGSFTDIVDVFCPSNGPGTLISGVEESSIE